MQLLKENLLLTSGGVGVMEEDHCDFLFEIDLVLLSKSIHFQPMFHFCTPLKYQETVSFLMYSGVIEVELWFKMG